MKKHSDPRHLNRINVVQKLFAGSFRKQKRTGRGVFGQIQECLPKIDSLIAKSAPQFPIEKIAKIDVAILRFAIFELFFVKKEPPKVIIDEAVEMAKEFGGEASPGFINGVLGTLVSQKNT